MGKVIGNQAALGIHLKQELIPDSSTTSFLLDYQAADANSLLVVLGGVVQEPNDDFWLQDSGNTIEFASPPTSGFSLYIIYLGRELLVPRTAGSELIRVRFTGDGVETNIALPVSDVLFEEGVLVFKDGVQQKYTNEWTLDNNTHEVIFVTAPGIGEDVDVYIHGIERDDILTVPNASITPAKLNVGWDFDGGYNFYPKVTLDRTLGKNSFRPSFAYLHDGDFSGDVTIQGNLTVNGTQTIFNTETLDVEDNEITLNSTFTTGVPSIDGGLRLLRGDDPAAVIRWDESGDKWQVGIEGSLVDISTADDLSAHVTDTGNPHAVTKAQVGLGSVTNDAQLLRAANDFNTFSQKVTVADADRLLIEDSADAGNKKYITLDAISFGVQDNDSWIQWRNAANDTDLNVLKVDASDNTVIQGENEVHILLNTVDTTDTGAIHISASNAIPGNNDRGGFISIYGEDYPDLDLRGSVNIGVGSQSGSGGVQGKAIRFYNSTFDLYHWVLQTNSGEITHTNYDVRLRATPSTGQQSLGTESTSGGGWITTYNNSHSTHPGKVIISTGRFSNGRDIELHTGIQASSPQTYHRFTIPSTADAAVISQLLFEQVDTYLHPNTEALSDDASVTIGAFGRNGVNEPTGDDRGSLTKYFGIDHLSEAGNLQLRAATTVGSIQLYSSALLQWSIGQDGDLIPEQSDNNIGSALKPVDTVYANNLVGPAVGGGINWVEQSSSATASVDTGYMTTGGSQVILTLPASSAIGDVIEVSSAGAGGFRIAQGAGQQIRFASSLSTSGAGGYLESQQLGDSVKLVCSATDTEWTVVSSLGNLTII
jgi:hypothetical protein